MKTQDSLGREVARFEGRLSRTHFGPGADSLHILGLLCVPAGFALGFGSFILFEMGHAIWGGLLTVLAGAAFIGGFFAVAFRPRILISIHDHGMQFSIPPSRSMSFVGEMRRFSGETGMLRWSEVASLRVDVAYDLANTGDLPLRQHEKQKPGGIEIQERNGKRVSFSGGVLKSLPEPSQLCQLLQQHVADQLYPELCKQVGAGQAIDFGPLSLSHRGLDARGNRLDWGDVDSFVLDNRRMAIMRSGLGQAWFSSPLADIENVALLVRLMQAENLARVVRDKAAPLDAHERLDRERKRASFWRSAVIVVVGGAILTAIQRGCRERQPPRIMSPQELERMKEANEPSRYRENPGE